MGLSLRIYIVHEDDSIERLAMARHERLLQRDPNESIPRYAGKRMRYALVVLDLVNRRPVEIMQIQYSYLSFDLEGRVDPAEQEKESRLAVEAMPPLPVWQDPGQVIDARHRFAKKRYDAKYRWTATAKIEAGIVKAIFGKGPAS